MRIIYIILLIAAALFYPLYTDNLSYLLLITFIIIPFLLIIQLVLSAVFFRCGFTNENTVLFMDEKGEIQLKLSNNFIFPVSHAELCIKAEYPLTGKKESYKAVVPVPARSTETVSVGIEGIHCGNIILTLEYVKLYDVLRIFAVKRFRRVCRAYAAVVPKINSAYYKDAKKLLEGIGHTEQPKESSKINCSSPDEITGFREFAPGDRLSRIHFKLSSRFDKDIIKIMGAADSGRYLLTADITSGDNPELRDKQLEKLMSCAYYMNEEAAEVYVFADRNNSVYHDGEEVNGGLALRYYDNASYFAIACALYTGETYAADSADGFIVCDISL